MTKLYWSSRKRSPKRLIVLLVPKREEHDPKIFFTAFRAGSVSPDFQIRSGATALLAYSDSCRVTSYGIL